MDHRDAMERMEHGERRQLTRSLLGDKLVRELVLDDNKPYQSKIDIPVPSTANLAELRVLSEQAEEQRQSLRRRLAELAERYRDPGPEADAAQRPAYKV